MAKGKKVLWVVMAILWIIVPASLLALVLVSPTDRQTALDYLEDENVRIAVIVVSAILLLTAIILIIDLIVHKNEKRQYLLQSETGNVLCTESSLKASIRSSISKFSEANFDKANVVIHNGNDLKADVKCNVFDAVDFKTLGAQIKEEIENGLKTMTGLENVNANVVLNQAQEQQKREIR